MLYMGTYIRKRNYLDERKEEDMEIEKSFRKGKDMYMSDSLRGWVMVALTGIFVLLYAAALLGLLRPLSDEKMVLRLEPIIFVIIGYYFGRLPGQQNEKALKDEISRQTAKADGAQRSKEEAALQNGTLMEKIKNTKAALKGIAPDKPSSGLAKVLSGESPPVSETALRHSVAAALNVLES
jgi:hypothetical protein